MKTCAACGGIFALAKELVAIESKDHPRVYYHMDCFKSEILNKEKKK